MSGEEQVQGATCSQGTCDLGGDVAWQRCPREAPCHSEAKRHSGIQMRTANVPKGIDHGHDDEAKRQRNTCMADDAAADVIDDDGTGARKNEDEGA